jgi:hypothetical protein
MITSKAAEEIPVEAGARGTGEKFSPPGDEVLAAS